MTALMIGLDEASRDGVRRAAGLLAGIGHAHPDAVDPGTALLCLTAAAQLRPLIGQLDILDVEGRPVRETLAEALTALADLPARVFATERILDAAADVRRAYRALI